MTPRYRAADRGLRDTLHADPASSSFAARGLRAACLGLAVVFQATFSGCCCYNDCVDSVLKHTEARMAYTAPCEGAIPCGHDADYRRGWRAGYLEVSEGRSGMAPAVPPHRYRTYKYQTGSGKQATAAWYQGFAAGAAAAKCQGLDMAARVYSVETPCCICQGPCHCGACGVLPSAEAMLRQQAMRRSEGFPQGPVYGPMIEERIIEEHVIDDHVIGPAPTPMPESIDQGTQHTPSMPAGPQLDAAKVNIGGLVEREIAPPSAVALPSNVDGLDAAATSPVESAPAVPAAPHIAKAAPPAVAPPVEPPAVAVGPIAPAPVAPVREPVATPQPVAPVPAPTVVESAPAAPRVQAPTADPYRFQPFEPAPVVVAPAPAPEVTRPLTQPGTILLDQSESGAVAGQVAPTPQAIVRETPSVVVRKSVTPPQPFPQFSVVEEESKATVNVPDSIGFPAGVTPQSPAAEHAEVRPGANAPTPRAVVRETPQRTPTLAAPFATSVQPQTASPRTQDLTQPHSIDHRSMQPATQPQPSPATAPRQSSLPRKLVTAPDQLTMPQGIASDRGSQTQEAQRHESSPQSDTTTSLQLPASVRTARNQPPTLSVDQVLVPSQLSYPADIQFSLQKHRLETIAEPMNLSQPHGMQPSELSPKANDIEFPKTVWPAAYEVKIPPIQ